ncbi:MAG: DUF4493 domain-containing protein, partial [Muribaculaceae bacterium]|nr:DUF4493 domain-containing protein [Muribaculaceae bacterium]
MKLYKGIICSLTAAAILGGCAKEDPFIREYEGPTGTLLTKCLAPSINNPDGLEVMTRAVVPVADDFNVTITRQGGAKSDSQPGTVQYKYSEMPEVLTLPTGDYKVSADYGDNAPAAWDAPYYYGESDFGIEANKITDDMDPIVAKLSNIRVTIVFHPSLLSAMSDDSMVEVKAGNQGVLTFVPSESRSAYFKYVSKSQTLAATFTGIVDGSEVIVTKSYDNVAPGNHYRITFRMHGIEDDAPGTIVSGLAVDASIEKIDMNHTVSGEGEEYLTDDWRPNQGGGTQDPDPGPVTPPVVEKAAPSITAATPTEAGKTGIDLDKVNEVTDNIYCVLDVK